MADMMAFPDTWEEFEKSYGFVDGEKIYTNGSRLIQSFRVKQWLDHIAHMENERQATVSSDCISRQDAKDVVDMELDAIDHVPEWVYDRLLTALDKVPSAQPEQSSEIQDILDYLDTVLHPIVSPEHWNVYSELHDMISTLPSARPEIVRCKDCKYADDDGVCQNSIGLVIQDDDDFCSRAERREE